MQNQELQKNRNKKNIKKVIFALIIIVVIAATLILMILMQGKGSKNIDYSISFSNDSWAYVEQSPDAKGDIVIANRYNFKPVREIGSKAFDSNHKITSVKIPDTVTSIGYRAFANCSNLESITIPASVTKIEKEAFFGTYIKNLYIEDLASWCSIDFGGSAAPLFDNLYLNGVLINEVIIPDGVTKIGAGAFNGSDITSVKFSDSVTQIEEGAFSLCHKLKNVEFSSSITFIGDDAFYSCDNLKNIVLCEGLTFIGGGAFNNCSNLVNINIPSTVTNIGYRAFDRCNKLKYNEYDNAYYLGNESNPYLLLVKAKNEDITSCMINNNTSLIHSDAFYDCQKLTDIHIPSTVTFIGYKAFEYSGLVNVYIDDLASWCNTRISNDSANPLYWADNLYVDNILIRNLVIPNSVTKISQYAFYSGNFDSLVIPNSVHTIENEAFAHIKNLTSVTIGNGLKVLGNEAFCFSISNKCTLTFQGTVSEWENITYTDVNYFGLDKAVTIKCTDGEKTHYIPKNTSGGTSSGGSSNNSSCGHSSCKQYGPFPCYGKNNTCHNKTSCAYDLYCDDCD